MNSKGGSGSATTKNDKQSLELPMTFRAIQVDEDTKLQIIKNQPYVDVNKRPKRNVKRRFNVKDVIYGSSATNGTREKIIEDNLDNLHAFVPAKKAKKNDSDFKLTDDESDDEIGLDDESDDEIGLDDESDDEIGVDTVIPSPQVTITLVPKKSDIIHDPPHGPERKRNRTPVKGSGSSEASMTDVKTVKKSEIVQVGINGRPKRHYLEPKIPKSEEENSIASSSSLETTVIAKEKREIRPIEVNGRPKRDSTRYLEPKIPITEVENSIASSSSLETTVIAEEKNEIRPIGVNGRAKRRVAKSLPPKIPKTPKKPIEFTCRLCGIIGGDHISVTQVENVVILQMVKRYLNINFLENTKLPLHICTTCTNTLQKFNRFYGKAIETIGDLSREVTRKNKAHAPWADANAHALDTATIDVAVMTKRLNKTLPFTLKTNEPQVDVSEVTEASDTSQSVTAPKSSKTRVVNETLPTQNGESSLASDVYKDVLELLNTSRYRGEDYFYITRQTDADGLVHLKFAKFIALDMITELTLSDVGIISRDALIALLSSKEEITQAFNEHERNVVWLNTLTVTHLNDITRIRASVTRKRYPPKVDKVVASKVDKVVVTNKVDNVVTNKVDNVVTKKVEIVREVPVDTNTEPINELYEAIVEEAVAEEEVNEVLAEPEEPQSEVYEVEPVPAGAVVLEEIVVTNALDENGQVILYGQVDEQGHVHQVNGESGANGDENTIVNGYVTDVVEVNDGDTNSDSVELYEEVEWLEEEYLES